MLGGTAFLLLRILEIVTLIPIWGMLAYFVDQYTKASSTPPDSILCLFIVALLATVWAVLTLSPYSGRRLTELWIAVIDLCFFGVLIAGVVLLAPLADKRDCVQGDMGWGYVNVTWKKECSMYKASWALGIINVIMFFFTACIAAHTYRHATATLYSGHSTRRRHY